jgi:hypothetical protein
MNPYVLDYNDKIRLEINGSDLSVATFLGIKPGQPLDMNQHRSWPLKVHRRRGRTLRLERPATRFCDQLQELQHNLPETMGGASELQPLPGVNRGAESIAPPNWFLEALPKPVRDDLESRISSSERGSAGWNALSPGSILKAIQAALVTVRVSLGECERDWTLTFPKNLAQPRGFLYYEFLWDGFSALSVRSRGDLDVYVVVKAISPDEIGRMLCDTDGPRTLRDWPLGATDHPTCDLSKQSLKKGQAVGVLIINNTEVDCGFTLHGTCSAQMKV